MSMKSVRTVLLSFSCILALAGCKKEETVVFVDNQAPPYSGIPTIVVQNYVNRLYIDLLGREPLDSEMDRDAASLEAGGLGEPARVALFDLLTTSTAPSPNGSSYRETFYLKIYQATKARLLEGVADQELQDRLGIATQNAIVDSLNGNWSGYENWVAIRTAVENVLYSAGELENATISIQEMYRRMMSNEVYDQINMNAFNFVNASYDDLYDRFPTQAEFENAYEVIEFNTPSTVFGQVVTNKLEYLEVLTSVLEYDEGLVRWAFSSLLAREATSAEAASATTNFTAQNDLREIYKLIVKTDEYAGFDD